MSDQTSTEEADAQYADNEPLAIFEGRGPNGTWRYEIVDIDGIEDIVTGMNGDEPVTEKQVVYRGHVASPITRSQGDGAEYGTFTPADLEGVNATRLDNGTGYPMP